MDYNYLASVLVRASILGLIVFGSVTKIPSTNIQFQNKVFISLAVVILYALIDYLRMFLSNLFGHLCSFACGCNPSANSTPSHLGGIDIGLTDYEPPSGSAEDLAADLDLDI